jgi:hypothetical protein
MYKKRLTAAILVIAFTAMSSFTSRNSMLTVDGYYANKDLNPATEQSAPSGNQSEVNIDAEVAAAGSFGAWHTFHCVPPWIRICAVLIIGNTVVIVIYGNYVP